MTALLADRRKSLGDRFCGAREECDRFFTQTQLPVILRTLLILEGGRFGTIATKVYTNLLLKWASKPELNYREAASITMALENVKTLIEEWAPRAGATKLGERARIPWHLCEIIELEGGEAQLFTTQNQSKDEEGDLHETPSEARLRHYWTFSPGTGGEN